MTTELYGSEVSWSLGTCSSAQIYLPFQDFNEQCCLAPGMYNLTCVDSYGDGWSGAEITIQGVTYCDDFTEGTEMMAQVTVTESWSSATEENGNAGKRTFHNLMG